MKNLKIKLLFALCVILLFSAFITEKKDVINAYVVGDELKEIQLKLGDLTDAERQIILDGCLINYYKATK